MEALPAEPPRLVADQNEDPLDGAEAGLVVGRRAECWECALGLRAVSQFTRCAVPCDYFPCGQFITFFSGILGLIVSLFTAPFCAERSRERASFAIVVEDATFGVSQTVEVGTWCGCPLALARRETAAELVSLRVHDAEAADFLLCWRKLIISLSPSPHAPVPACAACYKVLWPPSTITFYCVDGADDVARALSAAATRERAAAPAFDFGEANAELLKSSSWFEALGFPHISVGAPASAPALAPASALALAPARAPARAPTRAPARAPAHVGSIYEFVFGSSRRVGHA